MIKCCGTLNTGSCPLHHPNNIISFDNLKSKYSVNEDIHVEYTLHGNVQQASTRDWLGIFPRGWTNLQQYLTFEYALVAPRAAASSNRKLIFPRVFHQEASTSTEYQLVYVSREIQVLASSSYFRFIRDHKITDTRENLHVLHFPYRVRRASSSEKRKINSDQLASSGWAPPHIVLSDQSLLSIHPSRTIPANPRLSRACRSCGRPRDDYACGLAAGRARFLATHNASLAERVVRLERDLALAEGTKCSLAEGLQAYENFVAEMLRSLATKRVVKITDASGKEIVLQQLPIISDSEVKIIDELNSCGNDVRQQESSHLETNCREDIILSATDRALVGEYLSEDKTLPIKDDRDNVQTQEELSDDYKNEADRAFEKKRSSIDVETQTEGVDAKWIRSQNCEDSIAIASCNGEYGEEAKVGDRKFLEPNVIDQEQQKKLIDKGGWTDGETDKSSIVLEDGCSTLQLKPSAIVIQGSNVKFAIIRY